MTERNIERIDGGGPWLLELQGDLTPGETAVFRLHKMDYRGRKRYFAPWLPMDECLIKNLDTANAVKVTYNEQFGAVVEPNAADSFNRAGINSISVENIGGSTIVADDLVIQVSVEPFSADDAARAKAKRSPVQNFLRGTFNL